MLTIASILSGGLSLLKAAWDNPIGRYIIIGIAALAAVLGYGAWCKSQGRAEVRAEWNASVERARAAIAADDREAARLAKASDDEFITILANEATKRAERYDALRKAFDDRGCVVSDDDARGLQPR